MSPSRVWDQWRSTVSDVLGADVRSLAALRIVLALTVLGDLASRATNLEAHYSDRGVLPRRVQLDIVNPWLFSLNFLNGTVAFQGALFAVAAAAALAMLVGYHTRLAVFVVWVLMTSIHWRNFAVGSSADDLVRMLLFWSIFLPLGDFWSVDRARGDVRQSASTQFLSVATAALFLQIALVYWVGVLLKSGDAWRVNGTAIYDALSLKQLATPLGEWLLRFPELLRNLTVGTLVVETVAPLLLFSPIYRVPARMAGIVALVVLHIGIGLTLHLWFFSWISAACMVCFLPAWFWVSFVPRVRASLNLPGRIARLKQRPLEPVTGTSWLVLSRAFAFPVSANRSSFADLSSMTTAFSPPSSTVPNLARLPVESQRLRSVSSHAVTLARNGFAAISLVFVLLWNLSSVSTVTLPGGFRPYGLFLGLNQNWSMFSPYPLTGTSWVVVPGKLTDGREIDLLPATLREDPHLFQEITWDEPTDVRATFNGEERWRKYFETLESGRDDRLLLGFGQYICRNWNDVHGGTASELQTFDIVDVYEPTRKRGRRGLAERNVLWSHIC